MLREPDFNKLWSLNTKRKKLEIWDSGNWFKRSISIIIWCKLFSRTSDRILIIFLKSLKFGHFWFDHNLSLDSQIRTPTGIIIDHNKAKVHANFWIKRTFRSRVIHKILNFVKKGVVKNSNPVRRWHQPPIPSHPPPWGLHLWIFISPPLDSDHSLGTPLICWGTEIVWQKPCHW